MRKYLPILLILVAVGLGYGLVMGGEDDVAPSGFEEADDPASGAPGTVRPLELDVDPEAVKRSKRKKPRTVYQPSDPRKLPKGVLIIKPLGPDLKPLIDRTMSIRVIPRNQRAPKLGVLDDATGLWRFERVIAGSADVSVRGEYVIGRNVSAVVKRDVETTLEVHLESAGALKYDVITYAKTRPAKVMVELFDAQGRPSEAWFQTRSSRSMTQPRKTKKLTLGPEGAVFGIRPGRYRLKVTNVETDEWDDAEVDVTAGKTLPLTLTVRR